MTFDVIDFYSTITESVNTFNTIIDNDITENLKYWRDEYPWYGNFLMQNQLNEAAVDYFRRDQEYKNKVVYHYIIIYENYVPLLKAFKSQSISVAEALEDRLEGE